LRPQYGASPSPSPPPSTSTRRTWSHDDDDDYPYFSEARRKLDARLGRLREKRLSTPPLSPPPSAVNSYDGDDYSHFSEARRKLDARLRRLRAKRLATPPIPPPPASTRRKWSYKGEVNSDDGDDYSYLSEARRKHDARLSRLRTKDPGKGPSGPWPRQHYYAGEQTSEPATPAEGFFNTVPFGPPTYQEYLAAEREHDSKLHFSLACMYETRPKKYLAARRELKEKAELREKMRPYSSVQRKKQSSSRQRTTVVSRQQALTDVTPTGIHLPPAPRGISCVVKKPNPDKTNSKVVKSACIFESRFMAHFPRVERDLYFKSPPPKSCDDTFMDEEWTNMRRYVPKAKSRSAASPRKKKGSSEDFFSDEWMKVRRFEPVAKSRPAASRKGNSEDEDFFSDEWMKVRRM
jgi:hypothetical protein